MVSYQAAVLALFAASAAAQEIRVLTHRSAIDQTDQPYAVYLPPGYDPAKRYPLLVSLHGAGGDHRSGLRQIVGEPGKQRPWPWVIAAPFGRGSTGYLGIGERDAVEVTNEVERLFPIDRERVYLTGVSMGGSGAYHLLARYPEKCAAGVVVCGKPLESSKQRIDTLAKTPLWLFHGTADDVVPVADSRGMLASLRERKADVRYTEFPGAGHNIAPAAYSQAGLIEWLAQFRRTPVTMAPVPPSGLAAILAGRVSYVYGKGSAEIAREAANWGGLRGRPAIQVPVFADGEPLPSGNLFLIGTREKNQAVARFDRVLPLRLKPAVEEIYGLLFLSRAEDRLVAVSSGLPWWNGKPQAEDRGFRWQWLSLPYRLLDGLPDWVLFRGSLDSIVGKGSFDSQGRVRPEQREALMATGAVELDLE